MRLVDRYCLVIFNLNCYFFCRITLNTSNMMVNMILMKTMRMHTHMRISTEDKICQDKLLSQKLTFNKTKVFETQSIITISIILAESLFYTRYIKISTCIFGHTQEYKSQSNLIYSKKSGGMDAFKSSFSSLFCTCFPN